MIAPKTCSTRSKACSPPQLPNVVRSQPALEQERHGGGALQHKAVQRGEGQAQQLHALLQHRLHAMMEQVAMGDGEVRGWAKRYAGGARKNSGKDG